MSSPRTDFAAVGLPNGKVLLMGGLTSPAADTATVDLFDPVANTLARAAPMPSPRHGFTATLLSNGGVLVAGGATSPDAGTLASAAVYDPSANTWTAVASMAQPRAHHVAVLMNDGKVFVVGGDAGARGDPTAPEVYDPRTDTWTSVPRFNFGDRPRGPAITVLSDGRVFVFSGFATANLGDAVVQYYDPATAQASYSVYLSDFELDFSSAAQLADGTVLIVGGQQVYNPAGGLAQTIVFDVGKDRPCSGCNPWSIGPAMNVGHCHHTMTRLPGGTLLVAGGRCGPTESIGVAELYDPGGKKWLLVAPLLVARGYHTAILLADGRVLVAGGIGVGGTILDSTEVFTAA
jgi:hypothetical protein